LIGLYLENKKKFWAESVLPGKALPKHEQDLGFYHQAQFIEVEKILAN
jgi:hypothetical protein